jgi:hypothetical protein
LATYRIVCVKTEYPHRHIVSVGVGGTAASPDQTVSVASVRSRIDSGDMFETCSPSTGKTAEVHKDTCKEADCSIQTIRSASDAVADNNLDNLSVCP